MTTLLSLPPANYDIEYYRNDEFDRSITITDANGDPVDLSSKTLTMQVKKNKSDSTASAVATLSTASEINVSGASNNIVTFSGTYDIPQGVYYYDLENTTDNKTIMYGQFKVTGDVTRV